MTIIHRTTLSKVGRCSGTPSQHMVISDKKPRGMPLRSCGMGGRTPFKTASSISYKKVKLVKTDSRDRISHMMMPKLYTSAIAVYSSLRKISGATHTGFSTT